MGVASEEKEIRKIADSSEGSQHRPFLLKRRALAVTIILSNQVYSITYTLLLQLSYDDLQPSKETHLRHIRTVTIREMTIRFWIVFNFVWSS